MTPIPITRDQIDKMLAVAKSDVPIPANEFLAAYIEAMAPVGIYTIRRCECGCGQTEKPINQPEVKAAISRMFDKLYEAAGVQR